MNTTTELHGPRFLRPRQVAEIYGLTVKFLAHSRVLGTGPSYRKLGRKLCLYSVDEVEQWIEAQRRTSTSDDRAAAR